MPTVISFADQAVAFLAQASNQGTFPGMVGLAAFAGTSLTRRYGQGGLQVNGVTLGTPSAFRLQELLLDGMRVTGSREKRGEQPQRHWYELRLRQENSGWVDVTFTLPVEFALQAMPGSIQLGPGGDLVPAGVSEPESLRHQLRFQLPVMTDAFARNCTLGVYVFAAGEPSPVADLRRIRAVQRLLEEDPQSLASLDGGMDQRPSLFVQLYPSGILQGSPLSEPSIVQTFAAADVLAAFLTLPAM
ncbi:MAG: hypothetical protein ACXU60_05510 [Croceibacterium sp.]